METDAQLRQRLLFEYGRRGLHPQHIMRDAIQAGTGRDLDLIAASFKTTRLGTVSPNPFGDRITEALRREDDVVPHPVRRVETEADKEALWRSVEEYGRGG